MSEQINETYFAWLNKRIDKYEPPSREEVWNAATAEANKRINALESEVAELKALVDKYDKRNVELQELAFRRDALQANNHDLREALEIIAIESHEELWQRELAFKALSATPAESLAKHDNELLDSVAVYLNENFYGYAADEVRALKVNK